MQNIILTLMAVLVTLVLLGSGVAIYNNTNEQSAITRATSNVTTIIAATESLGAGRYAGFSNAVGVAGGIFPGNMVSAAGAVTNAWGGNAILEEVVGQPRFKITYQQVPKTACVNLLARDYGPSVISIEVRGVAVTLPATVADAVAKCSLALNEIRWTAH